MACAESRGTSASYSNVGACHLIELCAVGRYAVQYEDGDKEEFVISELKKKKNMLQPAGVEQRTDFEELDRLYAEAQAEWAAGRSNPVPCFTKCAHCSSPGEPCTPICERTAKNRQRSTMLQSIFVMLQTNANCATSAAVCCVLTACCFSS